MDLSVSGSNKIIFTCPRCNQTLSEIKSGFRCDNAACSFFIPKQIRQKVLSYDSISELITRKETSLIHGFHKRVSSQTFSARLYLTDEWKIGFRFGTNDSFKCPRCNGDLVQMERGYRCSVLQCEFILWNHFGGKKLSEKTLTELVVKRRTSLLKGFISKKNGKPFSAYLVMDAHGRVRFEFSQK